jgi:hypothetical protein
MMADIIKEIISDNSSPKAKKTKQGILISYRVLILLILFFLAYIGSYWMDRAEEIAKKQSTLDSLQLQKDIISIRNQDTIIYQLSKLTFLAEQQEKNREEMARLIENIDEKKANKADLDRLQDRFDKRFRFTSYPGGLISTPENDLSFRPNFKLNPHD